MRRHVITPYQKWVAAQPQRVSKTIHDMIANILDTGLLIVGTN